MRETAHCGYHKVPVTADIFLRIDSLVSLLPTKIYEMSEFCNYSDYFSSTFGVYLAITVDLYCKSSFDWCIIMAFEKTRFAGRIIHVAEDSYPRLAYEKR